jgi:hypothetical protein
MLAPFPHLLFTTGLESKVNGVHSLVTTTELTDLREPVHDANGLFFTTLGLERIATQKEPEPR